MLGVEAQAKELNTITDQSGDWTLVKDYEVAFPNVVDMFGTLNLDESFEGKLEAVVSKADVEAIAQKHDFTNFGKFGDEIDQWSLLSAVHKRSSDATLISNADILLSTLSEVQAEQLDLVGIFNQGGTLNFEGDATKLVVKHEAERLNIDYEEAFDAYGVYLSSSIYEPGYDRVINFKSKSTSIDVVNKVEGGFASGLYILTGNNGLNDVDVSGNLYINASAVGDASGIYISKDSEITNETASNSVDIDGNLTINSTSTATQIETGTAYGLFIDHVGNVAVNGNTHITVAGKDSYGIYLDGSGTVALNGDSSVIIADHALFTADQGKYLVQLFSKETTLNGMTNIGGGTDLQVRNTVNFNGNAEINGTLSADADAVFNIAPANAIKLGASEATSNHFENNLAINGGKLENFSSLKVDGTLTLTNTTFINNGKLASDHVVLNEGSLFLEEESSWRQDDGTLKIQLDGITELAGGRLSTIESNGSASINSLELSDRTDGKKNPTLIISNGKYSFDSLRINMTTSDAQLQVKGGSLNVDDFYAENGIASVSNTGELSIGNLHSSGKFDLQLNSADPDVAKNVNVNVFKGMANSDFTLSGGSMTVGSFEFVDNGLLTVAESSTLVTSSSQIFTAGLGEKGNTLDAEGLKHAGNIIFDAGSSLALNDEFYNLNYLESAKQKLDSKNKDLTLVFKGQLVDSDGSVRDETAIDDAVDGTILEDTSIAAVGTDGVVTVDKNIGGKTLVVDTGNSVKIEEGKTLTLVGDDENTELINFRSSEVNNTVEASGAEGGLTLGSESESKSGVLSASVSLKNKATLTAQNGLFSVASVDADDAKITVSGGELSVDSLNLSGESEISSDSAGKANVAQLSVKNGSTITVTGTVDADNISTNGDNSVVNIGKTGTSSSGGARGDLSISEGSISGFTFFLDPTWVDGQKVEDASRLVLNMSEIDGKVVVGENSYVVLGTNDDDKFLDLFENGALAWGDGEGMTLAAAFVSKPIDLTNGTLVVNGALTNVADAGSLDQGKVVFAENSVLVADVSNLGSDESLISANQFVVSEKSKAVVIGNMTIGATYKLTNSADFDFWNTEETLVSGNKLWKLTSDGRGGFTTTLLDSSSVYGGLMQGTALADAGMLSNSSYVNQLLTDADDALGNAVVAARFDAAMNTAGAAAVFSTAYDRSNELRKAVRTQSFRGESNAMWAQIIGGKTKLKGISTAAQPLHIDTDAYGIAFGGDVEFNDFVLGAAFAAGTGDSENGSVGVKDDFDFYGLSVYSAGSFGSIDVAADASMTVIKSDLTMGGLADVDADTTTAVYSLGVEAQRTFDFGIDVTPFIGMDVYHLRSDGYDNGHGAAVQDSHATAVEFPIGVAVNKTFGVGEFTLTPNFEFAVVPTIGDRDIDSKVEFAGAQSTYNFTFADDVKVRAKLGLNAEKENFIFGFNVGYDWGSEERSATKFNFNAEYRF